MFPFDLAEAWYKRGLSTILRNMKAHMTAAKVETNGPINGPIPTEAVTKLKTPKKKVFARTDARYWRDRVFRHSRPGKGPVSIEDDHYSIRIAFDGRRERFNTGEREKAAAAAVAAEIYRTLDRAGWDSTLERFKPGKLKQRVEAQGILTKPTVGQFLAAVAQLSEVRPYTLACYCRSFRQVVAGIMDLCCDDSRFDYVNGGSERWRGNVDAFQLTEVTPAKVQEWKQGFVKQKTNDPQAQRAAMVSANSILRQAKSLFSEKRGVLSRIRSQMSLPHPLPFDNVIFFDSQSMRYQSKVDAGDLLTTARADLSEANPEAFKILVLALCCGLRRNEIDKLIWSQVDFNKGVIRIETTRYFRAKSEDSLGEVDLDPELVTLMKEWKSSAKDEFVIGSDVKPRMGKSYAHYRTSRVLQTLSDWLREHGVQDRKFLHTLRKEFGSIVAQQHGIYMASRALRHADIQVTAKHYLDKKQRISIGLGSLLSPSQVAD